jgi:hypothetical protein
MSETLLYTIPQWFVFSGLIVIVYGWVEDKKTFRLLGFGIFFLLALFSIWRIANGSFAPGNFLTPDEVADQELNNELNETVPLLAKILPAYLFFVVTGLFSVISFWLDLKDIKWAKLLTILTGSVAIVGFFIVVGAVKGI